MRALVGILVIGIVAVVFAVYLVGQNEPFIHELTTNQTGLETIELAKGAPDGAVMMLDWGPRYYAVAFAQDLWGELPKVTLVTHKADFKTLVEKIRASLPDTRIAFLSINPSLARWAQADKQREANRLIKDYVAQGQNLDYIELFDAFLGSDGKPRPELFVADRLHQSPEGYKVRVEVVRPHLP